MYSYLDSSRCTQPTVLENDCCFIVCYLSCNVFDSLKSNFSLLRCFFLPLFPLARSLLRSFLNVANHSYLASLVCLIRYFISRSLTFNRLCCLSGSLAYSLMIHWRPRCYFASFFNLFRLDSMLYLRRVCSLVCGEISRRTVLLSRLYGRREREIEEEETIAP